MSIGGRMFLVKSKYVTGQFSHNIYRTRFMLWPERQALFTSAQTELCLEGFPRSANSYAYNAFSTANPAVSSYARHIHSPSQITEAARLGCATLLVTRPPEETIKSFMGHYKIEDLSLLLKGYISYYKAVLPVATNVVVSDFEQTTKNLNLAIQTLNSQFDTDFNEISNSQNAETIAKLKAFDSAGRGTSGLPAFAADIDKDTNGPELEFPKELLSEAQASYEAVAIFGIK